MIQRLYPYVAKPGCSQASRALGGTYGAPRFRGAQFARFSLSIRAPQFG
jgi:hypothetical protein